MTLKGQMRGLLAAVLTVCGCLVLSAAVVQADWCSVETPDSVHPGQSFSVRVVLKKTLPAGQLLVCHMHHLKKNGQWGGFYDWCPAQAVETAGETAVFPFTARSGADVAEFIPVVFAAPEGDWERKDWTAWPRKIAFVESAADKAQAEAVKRPESVTFKKSWIRILPGDKKSVRSGEVFTVKVAYNLDPSEDWGGGTTLRLIPLGPWIDNPDGVYTKNRHHVSIAGLRQQDQTVKPGPGIATFAFSIDKGAAHERDSVFFLAQFVGGDGKGWPWSYRGGSFEIVPDVQGIRLTTPAAGGLYLYGETPTIRVVWGDIAAVGSKVTLPFSVIAADGKVVAAFSKDLTVGAPGTIADIALAAFSARGTFAVMTSFKDREGADQTRTAYFCTIPDVAKALGGARAPFGCTGLSSPEECAAAARLGFSYCRLLTGWAGLEPRRGMWDLEDLDARIDRIHAVGIRPWIALAGAPEWVMPADCHAPGFCPYPFEEAGWQDAATTLARRYQGKIWGFEWLNEIVPGDRTQTPVADYARFCAVGTRAVKAVDPNLKVQLAGGLWPRNFRLDLIRAGVCSAIDVLPVHYASSAVVREARADAAAGGCHEVWDNESARGLSVWDMPPVEALTNSLLQSRWIMRRWPGELVAGATTIVYFGGSTDPAGNWSYLLDGHSPRPVAATLAVLAAKLGVARPVGAVHLDPGVIVFLFEKKDGRGLALVMSASETESCAARIPVGASPATGHQPQATGPLRLTDNQGNESTLAAVAGYASLTAAPMPVILENFDLAPLAAAASITIAGQDALTPRPAIRAVAGAELRVPVGISNPLRTPLEATLSLSLGDRVVGTRSCRLAPGATEYVVFACGRISTATDSIASVTWTSPAAAATRTFRIETVSADLLGNLLANGSFEQPDDTDETAAAWRMADVRRVALGGTDPGESGFAAEILDQKNYSSVRQTIDLPAPGRSYLYTAWMRTWNMHAGSNVALVDRAGKRCDYYLPNVFFAPATTRGWTLMTCILPTRSDDVRAEFCPVGQGQGPDGTGRALYDNVRVTIYDGTDYATEAFRAQKGIEADGDLSDWDLSNPVPLLCENQVTGTGGYDWSPTNLSGEAWFAWDDAALYFAARVKDDVHVAQADAAAPDGDAIVLALHPANRVPGTEGKALEWYLSSAASGGGACTLYRPAAHCAGLKSGSLATGAGYDVAVKTVGAITTYECRIPWSEVGGFIPEMGAKLGLSLRLTDADGGTARGAVTWGMGLSPVWAPAAFGVLTLVK